MNYFVTHSYNHKECPRCNTYIFQAETCVSGVILNIYQTVNPFKDEAQTALYKDPVRTALGSGYKNQSVYAVSGTSRCLFSDKHKTHKYSVGGAYSC